MPTEGILMQRPRRDRLLLIVILLVVSGLAFAEDKPLQGSAITSYQIGLDNGLDRIESYPLQAITPLTPTWLQSMQIGMREPQVTTGSESELSEAHPWQSYPYSASAQQDHLVYGSIQVPFSKNWHSEPTLYFSNNSANGDNEWRAVSRFNYRQHRDWSLGFHFGYGQVLSESSVSEGSVTAVGTIWRTRVGGNHHLVFSLTHESRPDEDNNLAMLAIELKLPKVWR